MERKLLGNTSTIHMDDFIIRPAQEADAQRIGDLWEKLATHHHQLDPNLPQPAPEGHMLYGHHIYDHLNNEYTRILVAEYDTEIIGYVMGLVTNYIPPMFLQEPGGLLADIYVADAYRQSGVGKRLVDELIIWLKSHNITYMEWHVAAKNRAARAFWDTIGGQEIMIHMRMDL